MIEVPELRFSMWFEWDNRRSYEHRRQPGVYLIAITSNMHMADTLPLWKDVVYIGMTNSVSGLEGRWRQLDRTIMGGRGHSGGKSMRKDMGDYSMWKQRMYVAAMSVDCNAKDPSPDDYLQMGRVAFYEYEAFSEYARAVGGHPRYNKR